MVTIRNWHRYVYAALGGVLAVCMAIQSGAIPVSPAVVPYAVVAVVFLGFFLPHFGADTSDPPPRG
jgi:hypothetical protein